MLTHRHIQEEIIEDILSWLPVKSLFRFKCVSKSWKALICEPSFKKKHFNHPKNDKLLIQRRSKDGSMSFYCSSLLMKTSHGIVMDVHESLRVPRYYMIHCCCDGLFLYGMWTGENQKNFLWNPSTRESAPLPSHYNDFFDSFLYGLVYDSTSDDYKVFKVLEGDETATLEILSLKTGSWRKIDVDYDCVRFEYSDSMDDLAFVQGSFHWLASLGQGPSLISFNISNEVFGELPLPEEMRLRPYHDQGVTVLGGMLSVNCVDVKENSIVYDLWVMKEYGVKNLGLNYSP